MPGMRDPLEENPVIIPPTWNKTAYHEQIDIVWRKASLEMENADLNQRDDRCIAGVDAIVAAITKPCTC